MGSLSAGILLLLLLNTCQAHDLIADVCSESDNPSLCIRILRSDSQSSEAHIPTLCEIIVQKALASIQVALNVAKSLSKGTDKEKCDVCAKNYSNAIDNLRECQVLLKMNDMSSISTILQKRVSKIRIDITTCDAEFGGNQPPMLKAANRKCRGITSMLLVFSKHFSVISFILPAALSGLTEAGAWERDSWIQGPIPLTVPGSVGLLSLEQKASGPALYGPGLTTECVTKGEHPSGPDIFGAFEIVAKGG
ncbi:hypothetical protein Salat_2043300 [Sesamum alatum]|uniref:Pectinesterase inhibitor domain-containing protein n=1 Tax=Sesamum alatum TaxID=300844 RepID=A0AAE1Y0L2_9LAMI|nr:hypothetical protein Salat_2043300 [Sesamum alatum]